MSRTRLATFGLFLAILSGCSRSDQYASDAEATDLQGTWEITSVQRNGEADPGPVGAHLVFAGNRVQFALGRMKLQKPAPQQAYLS
jgi:hypothetical protein